MKRFLVLSFLSLGLSLGAAGVARADLPPPNSSDCTNKKAGDSCVDDAMKPGACVSSTCTELDYSHGTPPTTTEVACLLCDTTAAPSSSSGCALSAPSAGDAPWWAAAVALSFLVRRRARRSR